MASSNLGEWGVLYRDVRSRFMKVKCMSKVEMDNHLHYLRETYAWSYGSSLKARIALLLLHRIESDFGLRPEEEDLRLRWGALILSDLDNEDGII